MLNFIEYLVSDIFMEGSIPRNQPSQFSLIDPHLQEQYLKNQWQIVAWKNSQI